MYKFAVALFTRAWIEIVIGNLYCNIIDVALFTRAWIEIPFIMSPFALMPVALFTRAWIEIATEIADMMIAGGRPLYEGVD